MTDPGDRVLADILAHCRDELLDDWWAAQQRGPTRAARRRISRDEAIREGATFLDALHTAVASGDDPQARDGAWGRVRDQLAEISRSWAEEGFSPSETATFVFSLKRPLFERIRAELPDDASAALGATWHASELVDRLGLITTEVYQSAREDVIRRQQRDMLELSTPVVSLWTGILALPLIGTLDSARTQVVMETLLARIVETGADIAIIDITGVPAVDTLTAQHLIKTVTAARLMGAECIISGIRPQIAQTIVHLGVELTGIVTKATLADAFRTALQRLGHVVPSRGGQSAAR